MTMRATATDFTIAAAEPNDVAAVVQIERAAFSDPWSERSFRALLAQPGVAFRVARRHGHVAGFVVAYYVVDEAELANLAVAVDERGRGIGAALLADAIAVAREQGAGDMWLEVRPSNQAARALYTRFGFVEVGARKRYYRDPDEDAVIMRCPLGPGP
jgi:ribosomal-protein-alanine N-acetyltransferase